jgi:hypothetical protein
MPKYQLKLEDGNVVEFGENVPLEAVKAWVDDYHKKLPSSPIAAPAPSEPVVRGPIENAASGIADYVGGLDRSIVQGATLGGGDEAEAALKMMPNVSTGNQALDALRLLSEFGGVAKPTYGENLDAARQNRGFPRE